MISGVGEVSGADAINKAVMNLISVMFDETFKEIRKTSKGMFVPDSAVLANLNSVTMQTIAHIINISIELQESAAQHRIEEALKKFKEGMK